MSIKLYILPKIAMEEQNVHKDTLVISIVSPGQEHPVIHGEHIYKFAFHDVTEEYFLEHSNKIIRPMEYEIAEGIVEVCMNHRDKKRWIIHCEAGISRSPAVAIGLAQYVDLDPNMHEIISNFPYYNMYVAKMINRAMEAKLKELENNIIPKS